MNNGLLIEQLFFLPRTFSPEFVPHPFAQILENIRGAAKTFHRAYKKSIVFSFEKILSAPVE